MLVCVAGYEIGPVFIGENRADMVKSIRGQE
jgi:hypothetical protein